MNARPILLAALTLAFCLGLSGCSGGCGSGGLCGDPLLPGTSGGGFGGDVGGSTGGDVQNYQYCPHLDGGLYPCWPDGGQVDLDAGAPSDAGPELDGGSPSDAG